MLYATMRIGNNCEYFLFQSRSELCDKMKKQLLRFNSFEKYFNDTVDFLIEVGSGKHQ